MSLGFISLVESYHKILKKMISTAFLLGAQHKRDSVENKLAIKRNEKDYPKKGEGLKENGTQNQAFWRGRICTSNPNVSGNKAKKDQTLWFLYSILTII